MWVKGEAQSKNRMNNECTFLLFSKPIVFMFVCKSHLANLILRKLLCFLRVKNTRRTTNMAISAVHSASKLWLICPYLEVRLNHGFVLFELHCFVESKRTIDLFKRLVRAPTRNSSHIFDVDLRPIVVGGLGIVQGVWGQGWQNNLPWRWRYGFWNLLEKRENMVNLFVNFYLKKEYPGIKNLATICLKDLVTKTDTISQNQVVTIF